LFIPSPKSKRTQAVFSKEFVIPAGFANPIVMLGLGDLFLNSLRLARCWGLLADAV
jgi:hypothetical protein